MPARRNPDAHDELAEVKRVAAIKLESDLHAYIDALMAVGIGEAEAVALARATLRSALARRRGAAEAAEGR